MVNLDQELGLGFRVLIDNNCMVALPFSNTNPDDGGFSMIQIRFTMGHMLQQWAQNAQKIFRL